MMLIKPKKTAKADQPPTVFFRSHNSLLPLDDYSHDLLMSVPHEAHIHLEFVKPHRNYERLKAYWAILKECVNATGCSPSPRALHVYCKIAAGLVDHIMLKDGSSEVVPSSIAFDKMSEVEMIEYFEITMHVLAEKFGYGG